MNFFEKLMLARRISFSEGRITLLDQRSVIFPSDFISIYTLKINENPDQIKALYLSAKRIVNGNFGSSIKSLYSSEEEYPELIKKIAEFGGWGTMRFENVDMEKGTGNVIITNAPIGTYLKGKVNTPSDHLLRGFCAGGAAVAFGKNVDALEIECVANGADKCKMIIDNRKNLEKQYKDLFNVQVGDIEIRSVKNEHV